MNYEFLDVSGFFLALTISTYIILGGVFTLDVFFDNLTYVRKIFFNKRIDYRKRKDLMIFEYSNMELNTLEEEIKRIRKIHPYNEYLGVLRDTVSQKWDETKPIETIVNAVVVLEGNKFKRL